MQLNTLSKMIQVKNNNEIGREVIDFYSGEKFILNDEICYQTESGEYVMASTARKRGFAVAKSFVLPSVVKSIEGLRTYAENVLKMNCNSPEYRDYFARYAKDKELPDLGKAGREQHERNYPKQPENHNIKLPPL